MREKGMKDDASAFFQYMYIQTYIHVCLLTSKPISIFKQQTIHNLEMITTKQTIKANIKFKALT